MNTKIFALLIKNLQTAFNLPKYASLRFDADTVVDQLPWTPARYRKFKDSMWHELQLPGDYVGTVHDVVMISVIAIPSDFFQKFGAHVPENMIILAGL